jgi:hypothetical protein
MAQTVMAQDTVTGAFEGTVSNSKTGAPIKDADVQIINQQTGIAISLRTDLMRFIQEEFDNTRKLDSASMRGGRGSGVSLL